MKAHLLHPTRDFDWKWVLVATSERDAAHGGWRYNRDPNFDPRSGLPWNDDALTADLSLNVLFEAMARDDGCIFVTVRKAILAAVTTDLETVHHRQDVLRDSLQNPDVIRELYALAIEAVEAQKGRYFTGLYSRSPDSVLRDGMETMERFLVYMKKLRRMADTHAHKFHSKGWTSFFAMLKRDLDEDYFALVHGHLGELKFRHGELISAGLGEANKGRDYTLHRLPYEKRHWWDWWNRLFQDKSKFFAFELHPRDEAGAQALNVLRNRGMAAVADALGQAGDHVRDFFGMLRVELAFYVGCLNLHDRLAAKGEPTYVPTVRAADEQRLSFQGLYDVCLTLSVDRPVVGNDATGDGKTLLVITGPNTGGKSTFLRSVGLAQLLAQSGMFVPAEAYSTSLCQGILTHFKREEDAAMASGKFDEEMSRMNQIVEHFAPYAMILFNESFSATNEREGSEIARQIVDALLEGKARVLFVTHMYELAHGFHERRLAEALFLRASRQTDGTRTYRLTEGEPLPTSFGHDLYYRIFGEKDVQPSAHAARDHAPAP